MSCSLSHLSNALVYKARIEKLWARISPPVLSRTLNFLGQGEKGAGGVSIRAKRKGPDQNFHDPPSPNAVLDLPCVLISYALDCAVLPCMSSSVNSRQKNGFWSYVPFGGSPRRRSVSLPYRATNSLADASTAAWDPFEKADRHSTSGASHSSPTILESLQN